MSLCCCLLAFSGWGEQKLFFVAVCWLLPLLLGITGSRHAGFSNSRARAQYLQHMGLVVLWLAGSSRSRNRPHVRCISGRILNHWTTRDAQEEFWRFVSAKTCLRRGHLSWGVVGGGWKMRLYRKGPSIWKVFQAEGPTGLQRPTEGCKDLGWKTSSSWSPSPTLATLPLPPGPPQHLLLSIQSPRTTLCFYADFPCQLPTRSKAETS